jgi:DNA helicase-2/ATP-dependent DNA helicase PcrA
MTASGSTRERGLARSGALRPRLLVYEAPDGDALLEPLSRLFPSMRPALQGRFEVPVGGFEAGVLPVWHLKGGWLPRLPDRSAALLRGLVYPLVADDEIPFVLSCGFPERELAPRSLLLDQMHFLDLEDIHSLLVTTGVHCTFAELPVLSARTPLTPIEVTLLAAMREAGIEPRLQASIGQYVVDFLVETTNGGLAIEADGRAYHQPVRDAERDDHLRLRGIDVVRFSGSEIHRDAAACARRVKVLLNGDTSSRNKPLNRAPLDESQQRAVAHLGGAARVLAPAGAGKTRVLAERVAELVERGADPASILVLAFNRKAYDKLCHDLKNIGLPVSRSRLFDETEDGVRCATFNAFGRRFLRERLQLYFDVNDSRAFWRELMQRALAAAQVDLQGTRRGTDPIGEFLRARDRARADLAPTSELEVELERFDANMPAVVVAYGPVDHELERLRLAERVESFDDQITTAVQLLLDNPSERRFVQGYFTHVLVDEFQDLNAAQLALVELVSRPWRNVFAVGDDDQLIYGWNYAKPANLLAFMQRMPPGAASYTLSTNYRCAAAIVDASRRVIDNNKYREPKDIRPRADAPAGQVSYLRSPAIDERMAAVVNFVHDTKKRVGQYQKVAVLCRYKAQQPIVALALDQAKIPRTPLVQYHLFSDPAMHLLRAYLQLVRDPEATSADELRLTLNRPNRYATNELLARVSSSTAPWDALTRLLNAADSDEEPWRRGTLRDFQRAVCALHDRHRQTSLPALQVLDEVVRAFALINYWSNQNHKRKDADDAGPLKLLDLVRLHAADHADLDSFLAHWDERATAERRGDDGSPSPTNGEDLDRVVISTIHAAKGREYDSVAIVDYDVDLSSTDEELQEEERRVFYVAMTRAKQALLLTVDANKATPRFVRESIAPQQADEPEQMAIEKLRLAEAKRDATHTLGVSELRLEAIANGNEERRLTDELAHAQSELDMLRPELAELEAWIARSRFWHSITGERRRAQEDAARLRCPIESRERQAKESARNLVILRRDPTVYAEPFAAAVELAQAQAGEAERRTARLDSRQTELSLLSGAFAAQSGAAVLNSAR